MTGTQTFDQWLKSNWPTKVEAADEDDVSINEAWSHPDSDDLTFFALEPNQLTLAETAAVSGHLESCGRCQRTVAHLKENKERFQADLASERKHRACTCRHPVCGCG